MYSKGLIFPIRMTFFTTICFEKKNRLLHVLKYVKIENTIYSKKMDYKIVKVKYFMVNCEK